MSPEILRFSDSTEPRQTASSIQSCIDRRTLLPHNVLLTSGIETQTQVSQCTLYSRAWTHRLAPSCSTCTKCDNNITILFNGVTGSMAWRLYLPDGSTLPAARSAAHFRRLSSNELQRRKTRARSRRDP